MADPTQDFFTSGGTSQGLAPLPAAPPNPVVATGSGDRTQDFFASGGASEGVSPTAPKKKSGGGSTPFGAMSGNGAEMAPGEAEAQGGGWGGLKANAQAALQAGTAIAASIPGGLSSAAGVLAHGVGQAIGHPEWGMNDQEAVDNIKAWQKFGTYQPTDPNAANSSVATAPQIIAKPLTAAGDAVGGGVVSAGTALHLPAGVTGAVASLADLGVQNAIPAGAGKLVGLASDATAAAKVASSAETAQMSRIRAGYAPTDPAAAEAGAAKPLSGVGAASPNFDWSPMRDEQNVEGAGGTAGNAPIIKMGKSKGAVPEAEQIERSQIAQEINPGAPVRTGVITGDENDYRNEYDLARSPNPTGAALVAKEQMAGEQTALANYAQARVDATGASGTMINDYRRGEFMNSTLAGPDGMMGAINAAKATAYNGVMTEGAQVAAKADNLTALLNDPIFQAEAERNGFSSLISGTSRLLDTTMQTGFKGAPPGSVAALERLRQSNNAARNETGSNAGFIKQMNDAIDADQTAAAQASGNQNLISGLEGARAIHRAQQTVISSPGIKRMVGDVDANGVQTSGQIDFEKIPQKLNDMPFDQWRHVWDTAGELAQGRVGGLDMGESIPQSLRDAATQMQREMAGSLAREAKNAGGSNVGKWNAKAFNETYNALQQKISLAMDPTEQKAFNTLNRGGFIMPGAHSYEGSALQTIRSQDLGLWQHLPNVAAAAGTAVGEAVGGPAAAAAGGWVSRKAGEKGLEWMAAKNTKAQASALSDAWAANAKLGQ